MNIIDPSKLPDRLAEVCGLPEQPAPSLDECLRQPAAPPPSQFGHVACLTAVAARTAQRAVPTQRAHQRKIIAAFAAIYLIWGSTYLAIRWGLESLPPFYMAGSRFLCAVLLLYAYARWRGASAPDGRAWRHGVVAGAAMLLVGNGGVTWGQRVIPSGVAALVAALIPLWMVLLDFSRPGGAHPARHVWFGLAAGFAGVAVLVGSLEHELPPGYGWGLAALLVASLGWATGSTFQRTAHKPASAVVGIAVTMIAGGILLLTLGTILGEAETFSIARVSVRSALSWVYLMLMGSIVGFSAYIWLLRVCPPSRVATYAYVNPLVAVLLGCTLGREPLTAGIALAAALIVGAVVVIVGWDGIGKVIAGGAGAAPSPARSRPG